MHALPDHRIVENVPGGIPARGLPVLLAENGYRSAFFTSAELSFERKDRVLQNLGFDESYGAEALGREGYYEKAFLGFEDRVALEPALAWAEQTAADGSPFLLTFLTLTTHYPYDVPPDFPRRTYSSDTRLDDYLNAVRYTDGVVRDLVEGFRERGLLDSTLFVITADHGQAFGEHGERVHGNTLYEEGLQVPALLYSPALFPEARRIGGLRQHYDLLPTIADVLNYDLDDEQLPGQSLFQPVSPDRTMYHAGRAGTEYSALRRGSMKYIYRAHDRSIQAFDLARDPAETTDLASSLSMEVIHAVEAELIVWQEDVAEAYRAACSTQRTKARTAFRKAPLAVSLPHRRSPSAGAEGE